MVYWEKNRKDVGSGVYDDNDYVVWGGVGGDVGVIMELTVC